MKKLLLIPLILVAFAACKQEEKKEDETTAAQETVNSNKTPEMAFEEKALESKMIAADGTEKSFKNVLEQYKGETVVIDVWASWCPDCVGGMPKVKTLQEQYPDVTFLFLSYDKSPESWKEGIQKNEVKGEHYLIGTPWKGGAFSEAIKLDWIPRYMVLDKEGDIALFKAIEADDDKLIATLNTLK